jgi:hypothetical protein
MADNTVEPEREITAGSAVSPGSREVADDVAGQIRSASLSGSPLPRRIRPQERTLDDSRGYTA